MTFWRSPTLDADDVNFVRVERWVSVEELTNCSAGLYAVESGFEDCVAVVVSYFYFHLVCF